MIKDCNTYFIDGCGRCSLHATPACKVNKWKEELTLLRAILQNSGLKEELKWSMPCYTLEGKNVVMIGAFKEYCSVSFFKGILLNDPQNLLVSPGENSQSVKMFKFKSIDEINSQKDELSQFIHDAIIIEKSGKKVSFKKSDEYVLPEELKNKFTDFPSLKTAFQSLTPGRQRAYMIHFSQPKQSSTRIARIEKCMADILQGKGLNDR